MIEKNPILEGVKNVISTCALLFSCALVGGLIFSEQTGLSKDVHPALAAILLVFTVIWLSVVEGGQASLVGLAPVNRDLYKDTHKIAHKCTVMAHTGDALDRYLLGRQFMVVFIVFTINISGGPIADAALWGLPQWVLNMFLSSGLAMILFTTMCGQLNSQVNASHCMLDYLNTWSNYATLCVAMAIEFSGLVHSSYLIQIIVAAMAGKKIESAEERRSDLVNIFFFGRCFMSLGVLVFAFTVTLVALFQGRTTMWEGVPNGVAVVVFFFLMAVVGMLEGMQIAFFAVARIPEDERGTGMWASKTCALLYQGEAHNLAGFMIGRQLCVVSCMFFIARVTSLDIDPDGGDTLWGVSPGTQTFLNMGFLGALITTIVASIAWQLVASAFPLAFMASPFTYILLRLCLFLEGIGICNGAYVLAWIHAKVAGFQRDEVYIGTAEERRNKAMADDYSSVHVGAGHITKLPGLMENIPTQLDELMKANPDVQNYVSSLQKDGSPGSAEGSATDVEAA